MRSCWIKRDIFVMTDVGIVACLHISADDVHFDPLKYL